MISASLPLLSTLVPLTLHHLVEWIIVFCHRRRNAYLHDYPHMGDTIIHMPVTPSTDGGVIGSARWRSPCFVIRFIVISCECSPFNVSTFISLPQIASASHFEWTSIFIPLWMWLIEWWHIGLAGSPMLSVSPPFNGGDKVSTEPYTHREFLTLMWSKYWPVEVTGLTTSLLKRYLNLVIWISSV